jgi:hypothetical protein
MGCQRNAVDLTTAGRARAGRSFPATGHAAGVNILCISLEVRPRWAQPINSKLVSKEQ